MNTTLEVNVTTSLKEKLVVKVKMMVPLFRIDVSLVELYMWST